MNAVELGSQFNDTEVSRRKEKTMKEVLGKKGHTYDHAPTSGSSPDRPDHPSTA
jgi:hypothetical protein